MKKKVFILYKNSLFACGLETLLRREGLDVVGKGTYGRTTLEQLEMLSPDFIIAEVGKEKSEAEAVFSQLLRDRQSAKVVQIGLENNTITLYTGNRWTANTPEELVTGIIGSTSGTKRSRRRAHA